MITTSTMDDFFSKVKKEDEVFVYHGMEFNGKGMNFPGGPTDSLRPRAEMLAYLGRMLGPDLISMDIPMPDYGFLLRETLGGDLGLELSKALENKRYWLVPRPDAKHLVVGDSHALSLYDQGRMICRNDFKTLYGALQDGLISYMPNKDPKEWESVTFYFGNIDIRHHLCRYPLEATKELIQEYSSQVETLKVIYPKTKFRVQTPLPIENERRVIPKSGWYKGTPFYGDWHRRRGLRDYIVDLMMGADLFRGIEVRDHPKYFWNSLGELTFDVMEKPRSVHIRPAEYVYAQEYNHGQGRKHPWMCVV